MAFEKQTSSGKFVAWGKKKARENSFIVDEGKNITGKVIKLRKSDKYGVIIELKTKEDDEPIVVMGTTILNRELGYIKIKTDDDKIKWVENPAMYVVKEGDVIRITFNGYIAISGGNDAYDLTVEVDR
jgi:hypothetical protein